MPHDDELTMLREEAETLAAFVHMLQREYTQLEADFVAVLLALGDRIEVPAIAPQSSRLSQHIERLENPATGAVTFQLKRDPPRN